MVDLRKEYPRPQFVRDNWVYLVQYEKSLVYKVSRLRMVQNRDDQYLYEMLILESFQAGLSWECVLNKREAFKHAYDNFDIDKVCSYGDEKICELLGNTDIIRNSLKIKASINNSKIFILTIFINIEIMT